MSCVTAGIKPKIERGMRENVIFTDGTSRAKRVDVYASPNFAASDRNSYSRAKTDARQLITTLIQKVLTTLTFLIKASNEQAPGRK